MNPLKVLCSVILSAARPVVTAFCGAARLFSLLQITLFKIPVVILKCLRIWGHLIKKNIESWLTISILSEMAGDAA